MIYRRNISVKLVTGMREVKFRADKTLEKVAIVAIECLRIPKCIDNQPFLNESAFSSAYITVADEQNVLVIEHYPLPMVDLMTKQGGTPIRGLELHGLIPNWESTVVKFADYDAIRDNETLQMVVVYKKIK